MMRVWAQGREGLVGAERRGFKDHRLSSRYTPVHIVQYVIPMGSITPDFESREVNCIDFWKLVNLINGSLLSSPLSVRARRMPLAHIAAFIVVEALPTDRVPHRDPVAEQAIVLHCTYTQLRCFSRLDQSRSRIS